MAKKRMCNVCGEKPATVPDRETFGRLINRVCGSCHSKRLVSDWDNMMRIYNKQLKAALEREQYLKDNNIDPADDHPLGYY